MHRQAGTHVHHQFEPLVVNDLPALHGLAAELLRETVELEGTLADRVPHRPTEGRVHVVDGVRRRHRLNP